MTKPGGNQGGGGSGNSHDLKMVEKTGGGGAGTNRNIAKILQKASVFKKINRLTK